MSDSSLKTKIIRTKVLTLLLTETLRVACLSVGVRVTLLSWKVLIAVQRRSDFPLRRSKRSHAAGFTLRYR
ncbi:hypothetical protein [Nostoc sp. MG11]|uniref:hypothetical protein n=1 Tax=Nostoc sp. MG11 TaxID=2721166 RepID=UPI0018686496|nr:hypothetical protein [Nostoc sp. MG11]